MKTKSRQKLLIKMIVPFPVTDTIHQWHEFDHSAKGLDGKHINIPKEFEEFNLNIWKRISYSYN